MNYVLDMLKLYAADGLIIALYIISWILIFCLDQNKNGKITFLYSAWYVPLFILNPLIGEVLEQLGILSLRMVRIYWLIPISFVIAYACTVLCTKKWNTKFYNANITCITLILFIIITGIPVLSKTNFVKAENIYKLPDGVIQVCNLISDDIEMKYDDINRIAMPLELSTYARQYDSSLYMLYGRYPDKDAAKEVIEVYELMQADNLDVNKIVSNCEMQKCHYVVLDASKNWCTELPMEYIVEVGRYENYCIFYLNSFK